MFRTPFKGLRPRKALARFNRSETLPRGLPEHSILCATVAHYRLRLVPLLLPVLNRGLGYLEFFGYLADRHTRTEQLKGFQLGHVFQRLVLPSDTVAGAPNKRA